MQVHRLYVKIAAPMPAQSPVPPEFVWTEALVRRLLIAALRLAAETGNLPLVSPWLPARWGTRYATLAEVGHLKRVAGIIATLSEGAPDRTAVEIFLRRNASRWCPKQTMRALRWSRDSYLVALNGGLLKIADTLTEQRVPIAVVAEIERAHAH
jgi:hypothetical protein